MNPQSFSAELDEAPAVPKIGDLIAGKYLIDSILGTGGMGKVFGATHVELGQKVAIKVLVVQDDDSRREEARERFLREGRATAALISDHVVRVYDVGTLDSGAPFMVMEALRGEDLAHTVQRGQPLTVELAADCVRQAAEAIASAHDAGIVHRDLKPSNLFLTRRSDGTALVKVLDFGISKTMQAELGAEVGSLTATRSVLGTPFYMSPEQVRDAKKVDFRTDIWSLGLILHELLSGSPAFDGTTLPGVCAAIAADPPAALRLKRPAVPVELEAIVLKCLEKDASRRYQSARALACALAPWAGLAESGRPGSINDATIRSAPPMISNLGALHTGPTLSLSQNNGGTMASARLTESGEREIANSATEQAAGDAATTSAVTAARPKFKRGHLLMALAALGVLVVLLWVAAKVRAPAPAPALVASTVLVPAEPAGSVRASPAALLPEEPHGEPSAHAVPAVAPLSVKPKKPGKLVTPQVSSKPQADIFMER